MGEISDEVLMAYIDGELEEGLAEEVAAALSSNSALRTRAERFRSTRLPVQAAFDDVLREPVPSALLSLVRGLPEAAPVARKQAPVASLADASRKRHAFRAWIGPLRMVAGIASLVLAGAAGWLLHAGTGPQTSPHGLPIRVAAGLQQLLETAPSGTRVAITNDASPDHEMHAISTFVDTADRFCRHYGLTLGGTAFEGAACRTRLGWVVEHQARRVERGGKSRGLDEASDQHRGPLDQSIDAMMKGGLLDEGEERLLLRSGWNAPLPKR